MRHNFFSKLGRVYIVDDIYILEKYYKTLDDLFYDEDFMDEDIEDMEFDVITKRIFTNTIKENWILKYHLEYHGE